MTRTGKATRAERRLLVLCRRYGNLCRSALRQGITIGCRSDRSREARRRHGHLLLIQVIDRGWVQSHGYVPLDEQPFLGCRRRQAERGYRLTPAGAAQLNRLQSCVFCGGREGPFCPTCQTEADRWNEAVRSR